MSAAAKTLGLLNHFSAARPEIGLSELCRLAGRDKATTYRYLQTLEDVGFVEQNATSKLYCLGPAILQLAEIREATVPRKAAAEPALRQLADTTGETAHVAVLSGMTLYALHSIESPRHSTRAIVDVTTLPLHATASGIIALAFGPKALTSVAQKKMKAFTSKTPVIPEILHSAVTDTRTAGFGYGFGTYEIDVFSISAPVFDRTGHFAGSVSVASVATRLTPELERLIKEQLVAASRDITRNWGGTIPPEVEHSWATTLMPSDEREATS